MKPLTFYGKKTCVTCQKAQAYLKARKIPFEYFEVEKNPPPVSLLEQIVDGANVKASLNIRSKIYKEQDLSANPPDKNTAIRLMQQDPNLIKRPLIVDSPGHPYQGFDPESLKVFLKNT